jgi:parallel beta-helix repeat protein
MITRGDGVGDFEGIQVDGHDGVSVRNGAVRDFVEGVALLDADDARVARLVLSRHRHVGVFVSDSAGVVVEHTRAARIASSGIFVTRSHDVVVTGDEVFRSGGGIGLRVSDHVRIADNQITDVDCGGIEFSDGGTDSVIEWNQITGTRDCDGITLADGSDRNLVRGNRISGASAGVGIAASASDVVTGNVLRGNRFAGIYLLGGHHNAIERNVIAANGDGSEGGVHLLLDDGGRPPVRTVISGNAVRGNVGDGVLVDAGAVGTTVAGNTASRNTDDGIDIDATGTTVAGNTADRNGDLGIEAVRGTRASGNTATGNGDPRQCVGVPCG